MDAKELRIGNWIHSKATHQDWQIELDSIELVLKSLDKVEPIPLTEEWMVNLGFDKKHWPVFFKNGVEFVSEQGIMRYYTHPNRWLDIDYVHELQNLYFALTGKELECSK